MNKFCRSCGSPLNQGDEFCSSCGKRVETSSESSGAAPPMETKIIDQKNTINSSKPASLKRLNRITQFLKNPKQWIPMVILTIIWFVLSMLGAQGINPWVVKFMSFLTFAQAGMYGGVLSIIGGVIGKGIFAYFVSSMVMSFITRRNSLQGLRGNFKIYFLALTQVSINTAGPFVLGIAMALIVFNFLTGNGNFINAMAGLVGLGLASRTLRRKSGFIWRTFYFIGDKLIKEQRSTQRLVSIMVMGYGIGSILAMVLSLAPWAYLSYALGGALLMVGLILSFVLQERKAVLT